MLLAEADRSLTSNDLTSGAESEEITDGTVLRLGTDQDAVASQARVKTAFVKALGELPIESATERAEPWYQLALMYALGNPPSVCTTEADHRRPRQDRAARPQLPATAVATPPIPTSPRRT